MSTSIGAATRHEIRRPRIAGTLLGAARSWWAGWIRFASQMRDGVK
jgi:hypothetical protein